MEEGTEFSELGGNRVPCGMSERKTQQGSQCGISGSGSHTVCVCVHLFSLSWECFKAS